MAKVNMVKIMGMVLKYHKVDNNTEIKFGGTDRVQKSNGKPDFIICDEAVEISKGEYEKLKKSLDK